MHLLCGIDDSARPGAAYVAGALARWLNADLTLLHVVPGGGAAPEGRADACGVPVRVRARGERAAAARTTFGELANDVAIQTGARVTLEIGAGDAASRLAAAARELGCDLVVLGHTQRSRIADLLLGEVHGRLIERAPLPVVLVPAGATLPDGGRVLLGCHPSAPPRRAAALAGRLASRMDTTLVVARALPERPRAQRPTSWEVYDAARREGDAATSAAGHEVPIEYAEDDGDPAEMLVRAARKLDAALIVVGRRRRSAWRRLLRPSLASAVARGAERPVVVVPSAEDRSGADVAGRLDGRASGREPIPGPDHAGHGDRHAVLD